ncbi:MAG: hypothetical protein AAF570_14515 [Bacteroidota bacterium]
MNKAEKRYFKMQASLHTKQGQNNYILLFDAVDRLKEKTPEKVKAKFRGTKIATHFSSVMYQLQNLIMQTLRSYHAGHSLQSKIRGYMEEVELLCDRGLINAADKTLKKAIKLAQQADSPATMLQLRTLERRIEFVERLPTPRALNTIPQSESGLLDVIRRRYRYRHLNDEVNRLGKIRKVVDKDQFLRNINEIRSDPLLALEALPEDFDSAIHYLRIHALCAYNDYNVEEAYDFSYQLWDHWQAHPERIELARQAYYDDLSRMVNFSLVTEKIEHLNLFLAEQERILGHLPHWTRAQRRFFAVQGFLTLNYRSYDQGAPIMEKMTEWLASIHEELEPSYMITTYFNLLCFYFQHGRLTLASKWANTLLNFEHLDLRPDINEAGRIIQIMTLFDKGDFELVEYLLRSTYRYLRRRESMISFEKFILAYIGKATRKIDMREIKHEFKPIYDQLIDEYENTSVKPPTGMFMVIAWLESKVRDIPIAELMEEKLSQRPKIGA